jgi:SARP family transcriptional regulator, regulator of embCAB operon
VRDVDEPRTSKVQLCGSFFVEIEGERLDKALPGRQGRLLFGYLTANRSRPVERSKLVDVLWPQGAPSGAETTLRGLIFRMRQALGDGCLTGKGQVRLNLPEGVWIDFEAARGAIHEAESAIARELPKRAWLPARIAHSIAEGGFMPGYEGEWIDEHRRVLADVSLRALDCIAEAGMQLGGAEAAAAERAGRALIAAAPYRESGYRYLVRALDAADNPAEAIRVYEGARELFREELGISPSGSLRDLHAQLLSRRGITGP